MNNKQQAPPKLPPTVVSTSTRLNFKPLSGIPHIEFFSLNLNICRLTANISSNARKMIMTMLQAEPKNRPKIQQLIQEPFMREGYCPTSLPVSCLTMAPRYDKFEVSQRKPLSGINNGEIIPSENHKDSLITAHMVTPTNQHVFDPKESFTNLRQMLLKVGV